jgi:hypothetical protein
VRDRHGTPVEGGQFYAGEVGAAGRGQVLLELRVLLLRREGRSGR